VVYLSQGLIAPDFAGIEIGLAERLAARALAEAAGASSEQVLVVLRDTGDLGHAGEQLLAGAPDRTAGGEAAVPTRTATLEVTVVVNTLHELAAATGTGSQTRKLTLLAGLLRQATPLEARYLLAW
jgi:DNA ligase-1